MRYLVRKHTRQVTIRQRVGYRGQEGSCESRESGRTGQVGVDTGESGGPGWGRDEGHKRCDQRSDKELSVPSGSGNVADKGTGLYGLCGKGI